MLGEHGRQLFPLQEPGLHQHLAGAAIISTHHGPGRLEFLRRDERAATEQLDQPVSGIIAPREDRVSAQEPDVLSHPVAAHRDATGAPISIELPQHLGDAST